MMPVNNRSGSALLSVMIIITIVSLMAGGLYSYSSQQVFQSRQMTERIRARNIAIAGANNVVSQLLAPGNYGARNNAFPAASFGGGTYTIAIENTDNRNSGRAMVTSVGTFGESSVTVGVDVRDARRENRRPSWFDYVIFANGDLRFNGTPELIQGDLHTNNDWTLSGGYGSVEGTISARNGASPPIPADKLGTYQVVNFPTLSDPDFKKLIDAATARGEYRRITPAGGTLVVDGSTNFPPGIMVVDGNLEFRGSGVRRLNGVLYVNGSVTANGSGTMILDGTFLTRDAITINGSAGVFTFNTSGGSYGGGGFTDEYAEARVYAWW
jgi:hypothetical protein